MNRKQTLDWVERKRLERGWLKINAIYHHNLDKFFRAPRKAPIGKLNNIE